MLDEIKVILKESVVVMGMCLILLFVGIFGAVNWNSYCHPNFPTIGYRESPESFGARVHQFELKQEQVGKDAVIPLVWAVPMTVVGFFGAAVCGGVFANRNYD